MIVFCEWGWWGYWFCRKWLFSVSVDDEDTDSVWNDCFLWVWMMRILILYEMIVFCECGWWGYWFCRKWLFSVSVDDEDTDSVGNDCFLWVWMIVVNPCMRHGRCIGGMWRSYTLSWWDICGQSWRSDGRTKWQTLKFSSVQDSLLWKTSSSERISAGQDIFWGCQLTAFRDRFSTRSYQTDNDHVAAHVSATKTRSRET